MNFDDMLTEQDPAAQVQPVKQSLGRNRPAVGALPQVSLLPPEIRDAAKGRVARRLMAGTVFLALVVAGGAVGGASLLESAAQTQLDTATAQTQQLNVSILKFADVQKLQQDLAIAKAAAAVGSSTEVDWQKQIAYIERDMPTDYTISSITADSASPIADYGQGTTPLEMPRAASVQMTVNAPSVTELPAWLRKLRSIPTYADATATVDQATDTAGYSVSLTIHLSKKAIQPPKKEADQ